MPRKYETRSMTDWNAIVERHAHVVWRTVNRLVPNVADSEDCFQKTFVSAWEYSQKHAVRDWPSLLRHLATARALDRGRELVRQRSRLTQWPDDGVVDTRSCGPMESAHATDMEIVLRRALLDLKPTEAEVFCLICIEELSYREVAEQLDLSVNHVGVLLSRARMKLGKKLRTLLPVHAQENDQ